MSPVAKARVGGSWVDTVLEGYARVGGVFVAFGPSDPGGDYEAISSPGLDSTDFDDGAQCYNMGIRFTSVAPRDCVGVRWRVPDTLGVAQGGGVFAAALWDMSATRLAYLAFDPTPGVEQDILFDAVPLSAGVEYIACVYMNHYVYKAGSPAGLTSPTGNVVAVSGRLATYNGGAAAAPFPSDNSALWLGGSPLVSL